MNKRLARRQTCYDMNGLRSFILKLVLSFRRLACKIFGHAKVPGSFGSVGLLFCKRCAHIDRTTECRSVTKRDVERRMAEHPPAGYSFVSCNWAKRKAKFVSPSGAPKFVSF